MSETTVVPAELDEPNIRQLLDQAKAIEQTNATEARVLAQQARVLAHVSHDDALEAEAFYRLASLAYYLDHTDEAFTLSVEARDLAGRAGERRVEAWSLNLMGLVHYEAGNYGEALACCLRSVELFQADETLLGFANVLNTVAIIHHSLGDTERAIATYEAALAANKNPYQPEFEALTQSNLAQLRTERREFFQAVSLGEAALELSREHAPSIVPMVLANLGEVYSALGDHEQAATRFDEAIDILANQTEIGVEVTSSQTIGVYATRGRTEIELGAVEFAERDFLEVLQLAEKANARQPQLDAHEALSRIYRSMGRFEEALNHQEARFAINAQLFNQGTDLRMKTLQIAHDTEHARQQAEILRLRTSELESLVRGRIQDYEDYQTEAFQRLAALAELRRSDTSEHTLSVGDIAADIAHELQQDVKWCELLRLAARLHDIGKVATPDSILLKPGPLDEDECAEMMTHTTLGAQVLAGSSSPMVQLAEVVALTHHERWDGAGYPTGLAGANIPLGGRITSVADVYDALTHEQIYKQAWTPAEAVKYIIDERGTRFDPQVVDAFLRIIVRRVPELQFSASVPVRQRHMP